MREVEFDLTPVRPVWDAVTAAIEAHAGDDPQQLVCAVATAINGAASWLKAVASQSSALASLLDEETFVALSRQMFRCAQIEVEP